MWMSLCRFQSRVDYIQCDFAQAFCLGGCCRPINFCLIFWGLVLTSKTAHMSGLRPDEQKEFSFLHSGRSASWVTNLNCIKTVSGLRFLDAGEETKWDAWRLWSKHQQIVRHSGTSMILWGYADQSITSIRLQEMRRQGSSLVLTMSSSHERKSKGLMVMHGMLTYRSEDRHMRYVQLSQKRSLNLVWNAMYYDSVSR
jgi:hypothetical protein